MENNNFDDDLIDDEDDFAYDDEDSDDWEFLGEDHWEDQAGLEDLKKYLKLNPDWYLIKLTNFDWRKLDDAKAWCKDTCRGAYKHVGWSSGCSTKVGVAFEDSFDAMMFKMTWR